jgi:undecaprenyl-diphosphatase
MSRRASASGGVRALAWIGGAVVVLLLVWLLDAPIARTLRVRHPIGDRFDPSTLLRLAGYLPLWALVSLAIAAVDAPSGWRAIWSRGGVLLLTVTIASVLAELVKALVRRERPSTTLVMSLFRPWRDGPFSLAGSGWPSSHMAVAFAGLFVLCRLFPRATPIWLFLAIGYAFARLTFNLHFVSDVAGGAVVGYIAARACGALAPAPEFRPGTLQ